MAWWQIKGLCKFYVSQKIPIKYKENVSLTIGVTALLQKKCETTCVF